MCSTQLKDESEVRLFFYSIKTIQKGEQLFFDYGDRRKDVIKENPWLQPPKKINFPGCCSGGSTKPVATPPPPQSKPKRNIVSTFIDLECEVDDDDDSISEDNEDQEGLEEDLNFISDIPLPPDEDPHPNPYLHNTTQCPIHGEWVQNDCSTCNTISWKTTISQKRSAHKEIRPPPRSSPPSTPIPPTPPNVRKRRNREKKESDARINAAIREGLERAEKNSKYCKLCDKKCYKEEYWQNHLKGKLHQSKVLAQKQNDPITPAPPKPITTKVVNETPLQPEPHQTVCVICNKCVSKRNLAKHRKSAQHQKNCSNYLNTPINNPPPPPPLPTNHHVGPANSNNTTTTTSDKEVKTSKNPPVQITCNYCNLTLLKNNWSKHKKSKSHKKKENDSLIEQPEPFTVEEEEGVLGDGKAGVHFTFECQVPLKYKIARKIIYQKATNSGKVNYMPKSFRPSIKAKHQEFFSSLVIGNEFGDDGLFNNSHCHGYIQTKNKVKFEAVQQYFTQVLKLPRLDDLARPKDVKKCIKYCTKDDEFAVVVGVDISYTSTRYKAYRYVLQRIRSNIKWTDPLPCKVAPFERATFENMVRDFSIREKDYSRMKAMEDFKLRPWQQMVTNLLSYDPNDRTIIWIFDRDGDTGKSMFAKYISHTNPRCLRVENVSMGDIAYAFNEELHKIVIFDLPRQKNLNLNFKYGILEQLKNGHIFSPKYHSTEKSFVNVHVVVLCNYLPEKKQLTLDRWMVLALTKQENSVHPIRVTPLKCFNDRQDCPNKNCLCQNSVLTIKTPDKVVQNNEIQPPNLYYSSNPE